MNITARIWIARAKCVAKRNFHLAVEYLRRAGVALESAIAAAARFHAAVAA